MILLKFKAEKMIGFLAIFFGSYLTAFSGALAPGPLLFYTISRSSKHGWLTGFFVISGHALLEILVVLVLLLGMKNLMDKVVFEIVLSFAGGATLLIMGFFTLKPALKKDCSIDFNTPENQKKYNFNLLAGGFILSLSNPFFLLWWFFIGAGYLFASMKIGIFGVAAFFIGHTLADFTWYIFVSTFISKSRKIIKGVWYKVLLIVCGSLIIVMGIMFIINGLRFL